MTEAKSKFNADQYLIQLKGKDYLPVNRRIQWFRHDHPNGEIFAVMVSDGESGTGFRCTVTDGDGNQLATGHGYADGDIAKMGRIWEKAETAAIGRALAHAGYGTQFTGQDDDLDSDKALADAPMESRTPPEPRPYSPEVLFDKLQISIEARQPVDPNEPDAASTKKQHSTIARFLNEALATPDNKTPDDWRHLVLGFLFGVESTKDMSWSDSEICINWLTSGEGRLIDTAAQEAREVLAATLEIIATYPEDDPNADK